jgi:hypothetical protein
VVDVAKPLETGDEGLIEHRYVSVEDESLRAELGERGDDFREALGVVPFVPTDEPHPALFLEGHNAPPVYLLFVQPAGSVEGPGYLGGVHEGRDIHDESANPRASQRAK